MAIQKLEWRADYKGYSLGLIRVENTTADEEFRATDEIIEYKKGQVINVEERGGGIFRDTDTGHFFSTNDTSASEPLAPQYRLF